MNISLDNINKHTPKKAKFTVVLFILITTGMAMWLNETTLVGPVFKSEGALLLKVFDAVAVVFVQFLGINHENE